MHEKEYSILTLGDFNIDFNLVLTLPKSFLQNNKGYFTDLRNFMRKNFELFDDNSKIKTFCFRIVKQLCKNN